MNKLADAQSNYLSHYGDAAIRGGGVGLGLGSLALLLQHLKSSIKPKAPEENPNEIYLGSAKQAEHSNQFGQNWYDAPAWTATAMASGAGIYALLNHVAKMRQKNLQRNDVDDARREFETTAQQAYGGLLGPKAAAVLDQLAAEKDWEKSALPTLEQTVGMAMVPAVPVGLWAAYKGYQDQKLKKEKALQDAMRLRRIADAQRGPAPLQIRLDEPKPEAA